MAPIQEFKPPVVETVMGVQFEELPLHLTHYGLFWSAIQNEFPTVEERPKLQSRVEVKADFPNALWLASKTSEIDVPRIWFAGARTDAGQQIVQLQSNKLLQNWRTARDGADYPSFISNRRDFKNSLDLFVTFVTEREIGWFAAEQCELTYVNHIPYTGEVWSAACETFDIFSPKLVSDLESERFSFNQTYWSEQLKGRVHIVVQPARHKGKIRKVLDFRLTARGAPGTKDVAGVLAWLDEAHKNLLSLFVRLTRDDNRQKWGISNEFN